MGEVALFLNTKTSRYIGRVWTTFLPEFKGGPCCQVKWFSHAETPEIGRFVVIEDDAEKDKYWLARILSFGKTPILSDSGAEMELHNNVASLNEIRDSVGDLLVNVEILNTYEKLDHQNKKTEYKSLNHLNYLPRIGSYLLKDNQIWKELIFSSLKINHNPDTHQNSNIKIDSKNQNNFIKINELKNLKLLTERRSAIFGKTGSGKSFLAKILLHHHIESNQKEKVIIFDTQGEFIHRWGEQGHNGFIKQSFANNTIIFSDRNLSNGLDKRRVSPLKFDLREFTCGEAFEAFSDRILKGDEVWPSLMYKISQPEWVYLCNAFGNSDSIAGEKTKRSEQLNDAVDNLLKTSKFKNDNDQIKKPARRAIEQMITGNHKENFPLRLNLFKGIYSEDTKVIIFDIASKGPREQGKFIDFIIKNFLEHNQMQDSFEKNSDIMTSYQILPDGTLKPYCNPAQCLFVIDEAQLVFDRNLSDVSPVVRLFKEGRKYSLSSLILTQQPSSIPIKAISQCENIFSFQMTSAEDLMCLQNLSACFNPSTMYQIKYFKGDEKTRLCNFVSRDLPFALVFSSQLESKEKLGVDIEIFRNNFFFELEGLVEKFKKQDLKTRSSAFSFINNKQNGHFFMQILKEFSYKLITTEVDFDFNEEERTLVQKYEHYFNKYLMARLELYKFVINEESSENSKDSRYHVEIGNTIYRFWKYANSAKKCNEHYNCKVEKGRPYTILESSGECFCEKTDIFKQVKKKWDNKKIKGN